MVRSDEPGANRLATASARARRMADQTLDRIPVARSAMTEAVRVEVLDRALIIAAQALFALTPLLVVLAAFTPDVAGTTALDEIRSATGITQADDPTAATHVAATSEQVRAHTGLIGIVLVIVSALSFARAVQRLFERVWEREHRGGVAGTQRCLVWLAAWVVYLQLVVMIVASLGRPLHLSALSLLLQIAVGTALWWWTAHTLLMGRVPWSSLWVGALLTATGLCLQVRLSRFVMPQYAAANVEQFGGLGVIFAASTWLLAFGGVIVIGATIGRVVVEDPVLRRGVTGIRRLGGHP